MTELAGRLVTELSGGERQRALIAQTLAQETPVLLLDEPLNNLDLNHQLEVMQLLGRLHAAGKTIVVVLHDLNMAAQYCDELLVARPGHGRRPGSAGDHPRSRLILEVFRVRVAVHRQGTRPYLTPLWSRASEGGAATATGGAGEKRVHVIAGGGAASELIEELVLHGFSPTVGIVSVFDTDYATAQRYELEVISAPPFQPFPQDAVEQLKARLDEADAVFIAPVFFGPGNLEPLVVALAAARAGKKVLLADSPPIEQRDLSEGRATEARRAALCRRRGPLRGCPPGGRIAHHSAGGSGLGTDSGAPAVGDRAPSRRTACAAAAAPLLCCWGMVRRGTSARGGHGRRQAGERARSGGAQLCGQEWTRRPRSFGVRRGFDRDCFFAAP